MLPRPSNADVEQPPLLRDLITCRGEDERDGAFLYAQQRNCIPLQALSRVQRSDGYALGGGYLLGLSAMLQLSDDCSKIDRTLTRNNQVLRNTDQRGQGLPALPYRTGTCWWLRGPAEGAEHSFDVFDSIKRASRVAAGDPLLGSKGKQRLTYLGTLIEAFPATYKVGNASLRQRLFNYRRLGIDAKQDCHFAILHPGCRKLGQPIRDCRGLTHLIRRLSEYRLRAGCTLCRQGDRARSCSLSACHHAISAASHLGSRTVVADQLDDGR